MSRRLIYNGFLHLTPNHHSHGYWRTPEGKVQYNYSKLEPYINVVKTLERGRFDTLFIADVSGVYDFEHTIRAGSQFPSADPITILSALGLSTSHLGLAVTSNIIQSHPFAFARQLSSLDHYTEGRIGWNIVTSYLTNGFQNFGFNDIVPHDERYRWTQEYLDVTYKLWEHSWDDNAVLRDAATNRFFDRDRIHRIDHKGERYSVAGPHIVEPSLQRTPVLFQAGNSIAGREFAVRNAEVTFLPSITPEAAARDIAVLDELARQQGRDPRTLKKIATLSTVIGSTEDEARRKQAYLYENTDFEALQAFLSGGSGIDYFSIPPDTTIAELKHRYAGSEHVRSGFRRILDANPDLVPESTWGEHLLKTALLPGRFAGTPDRIADEVQRWANAGIDGFNVVPITTLGWWDEWVDHVVPVLQSRGLAQTEYTHGSLRHKLFGTGDRLHGSHRARTIGIRGLP